MDPFVVMEDADVDLAAEMAVAARLNNSGQVCIAPKRFIIPERMVEEFSAKCVSGVSKAKMGDPLSPETTLGPMSSEPILKTVEGLVQQSVEYGDQVLTGAKVDPKHGAFYHPTVIKLKDLDSPLWNNEVFGPVIAITSYKTEEQALKLANDTEYGLSAMVIGKNTSNAEKFAARIEAGMVYVNSMNKAFPDLPFGGCKNSGYGRESGEHGFESFANVQTFYSK